MDIVASLICGFIVGFASAILVRLRISDVSWQHEIVERGFALYDPITGEWRWKEPSDKEPTP